MTLPTTVYTAAALQEALATAAPGARIELAGGAFGILELARPGAPFPAGVTIAAADPFDPPRFTGVVLERVEGVVLEGLAVDWPALAAGPEIRLVEADGITLRGTAPQLQAAFADHSGVTVEPAAPDAAAPRAGHGPREADAASFTPLAEPQPAPAGAIRIEDAEGLARALAAAQGGEVLLLEGGQYGRLALQHGRMGQNAEFASEVVIRSADPDDPAVFDAVTLRGAANLSLEGVVVDYVYSPGDPHWTRAVSITDSRDIAIRDSVIDGDLARGTGSPADGLATGGGVQVRGAQRVTLEGNDIARFRTGVTLEESADLVMRGNALHHMRNDALDVHQVTGLLVEDNVFRDTFGLPGWTEHRDMIQVWTTGTTAPSRDVTIRGNLFDIGEGGFTQTIFMRNELVDKGLAGREMFYRDFVIEENVILNNHMHGINVGEIDGLLIRNNTLLETRGGPQSEPFEGALGRPSIGVAEDALNVVITGNATGGLRGFSGQPSWQVGGNAVLQPDDPSAPGFYGDSFVASTLGEAGLAVLPGGLVDRLGVGAAAEAPQGLVARFHVTAEPGEAALRVFDARHSLLDGAPPPAGTRYEWSFGDGSRAEGMVLRHAYAEGGAHDVVLTLRLPDGRRAEAGLPVEIAAPELWSFAEAGRGALDLGRGVALEVARAEVAPMLTAEEYEIAFAVAGRGAGELFRLQGSFSAQIDRSGRLVFRASDAAGEETRLVSGPGLADGARHEVALRYEAGRLELWVDGARAAAEEAGPLARDGAHDLTFGHPWGGANFDGRITGFALTQNASDFPERPETEVITPGAPAPETPETPATPPQSGTQPDPVPSPGIEPGMEPAPGSGPAPQPLPDLDEAALDALLLDFAAGRGFTAHGDAGPVDLGGPVAADGMALAPTGTAARVALEHVDDILGADSFAIDLAFTGEGHGDLFRRQGSLVVVVDSHGELRVRATSDDGTVTVLESEDAPVDDGLRHEMALRFDAGRLTLWLDGVLEDEARMDPLSQNGRHDLTFGHSWGGRNFDAVIDAFAIRSEAPAYAHAAHADEATEALLLCEMGCLAQAVPEQFFPLG
ncbi:LamG-like jellyroll fold domain-containing protein [Limimaricola pyoseonensis]|uniref:Concanavalin A-like lectin/glucanases superfamily protein n=1 Tax=Limimaricola pyoseonensis TaxID=521013 RepID=A0A1G7IVJ3_9RHOB|nr:LamG-like jellyroll fold domain-containing protein [Limimaricola pyoseonensis]SDF16691.1 Concanavalin A-like lectin/glucanases superfamily protein [Limimaricola pyoseonensis]